MKRRLVSAMWALSACAAPAATPAEPPAPVALDGTRADAPSIDGELDEPAWGRAPISQRFVDATTGAPTTPYTEARMLCDDQAFTLAFYGADEDVVSSDRVGVVLQTADGGTVVAEVDPTGRVHWQGPSGERVAVPEGVAAAVDADATLDRDDLEDEEWIVELRVPWRALGMDGAASVRANLFRRDRPRGSAPRSLAWSAWRERRSSAAETLGVLRCPPGATR